MADQEQKIRDACRASLVAAALSKRGVVGFTDELALRGFVIVPEDHVKGLLEANSRASEERRALQQEIEQARDARRAAETLAEQAAEQAAALLRARLEAKRERDDVRQQRDACLVALQECQFELDEALAALRGLTRVLPGYWKVEETPGGEEAWTTAQKVLGREPTT